MNKIRSEYADKSSLELVQLLSAAALAKKAEDLVILDVRTTSGFCDYFVIMSGRSSRHVQGLAAAVDEELGSKRLSKSHSEGLEEGQWVLLDFNDVVVHIFYEEARQFYDLEGLWHDAPRVSVETSGVAAS